jgi:predicted MPP superfamily phosphohydrolase
MAGRRAGIGLGAAVVGGGLAYAAGWERTAFVLRRETVPILPGRSGLLKILHISDAHIRAGQTRKQEWIRGLADLHPDLVVTTGDNLGGRSGVPAMLYALEPLLARPGAFVLGSNDYYGPRPKNPLKYFFHHHKRFTGDPLPWEDLASAMREAGWHDLTNSRVVTEIAGLRVELRGVDDPHLKRDRLAAVAGKGEEGALQLGVVHAPEPRVLDAFVDDGVALVLAGHTHGGQLRVPGVGALVTNCGLDRARSRGLSRYRSGDLRPGGPVGDEAWLHVSAGLGTSVYAPVRFACRPEATLLTLVPAERASRERAAGGPAELG